MAAGQMTTSNNVSTRLAPTAAQAEFLNFEYTLTNVGLLSSLLPSASPKSLFNKKRYLSIINKYYLFTS